MSLRSYGIYLSYAPTVDLRKEGLGHYLAAFLKGASGRDDVRFTLVCPSWSKTGLVELLEGAGISIDAVDIISPPREPAILRLFEWYTSLRKKRASVKAWRKVMTRIQGFISLFYKWMERRLVGVTTFSGLIFFLALLLAPAALGILILPFLFATLVGRFLYPRIKGAIGRVFPYAPKMKRKMSRVVITPKNDRLVLRLYQVMERVEADKLLKIVESLTNVRAWYCPTAFWPAFNKVSAPSLMCVPDVVLSDFPGGFSAVGGDRFLMNFDSVERAIRGGKNFVTYSEVVKEETLVRRYAIDSAQITVVHHAPKDLKEWTDVKGFVDSEAASRDYCKSILMEALRKSSNVRYMMGFLNSDVRFIFYASQFRPNKNVVSLLAAYNHLLKHDYIGHKLILTGNPQVVPDIYKYVEDNGLQNDVIFLHGLTLRELAACYKLADLAVNPSLSEGGCPFTFAEALSVDTPVVMAKIRVSEEILVGQELKDATFFDPYDWRDLACKVKWALHHREELLSLQKEAYSKLSLRSWRDVVDEHIAILDKISGQALSLIDVD